MDHDQSAKNKNICANTGVGVPVPGGVGVLAADSSRPEGNDAADEMKSTTQQTRGGQRRCGNDAADEGNGASCSDLEVVEEADIDVALASVEEDAPREQHRRGTKAPRPLRFKGRGKMVPGSLVEQCSSRGARKGKGRRSSELRPRSEAVEESSSDRNEDVPVCSNADTEQEEDTHSNDEGQQDAPCEDSGSQPGDVLVAAEGSGRSSSPMLLDCDNNKNVDAVHVKKSPRVERSGGARKGKGRWSSDVVKVDENAAESDVESSNTESDVVKVDENAATGRNRGGRRSSTEEEDERHHEDEDPEDHPEDERHHDDEDPEDHPGAIHEDEDEDRAPSTRRVRAPSDADSHSNDEVVLVGQEAPCEDSGSDDCGEEVLAVQHPRQVLQEDTRETQERLLPLEGETDDEQQDHLGPSEHDTLSAEHDILSAAAIEESSPDDVCLDGVSSVDSNEMTVSVDCEDEALSNHYLATRPAWLPPPPGPLSEDRVKMFLRREFDQRQAAQRVWEEVRSFGGVGWYLWWRGFVVQQTTSTVLVQQSFSVFMFIHGEHLQSFFF